MDDDGARWTPPHTRARSGHTHARTMAFILGGFSHLFAFKGAFQAEVRANSRETRRPNGESDDDGDKGDKGDVRGD